MTLWTVAHQAPLFVGLSRQEYWRRLPCPPPEDLPNPGTEPRFLMSPILTDKFFTCLLLLLSRFSGSMEVHQAPPSLGFSRQEHWSGLPFPSPMHESESEVAQSCPTLSDPMDCSLPGSSIHGIFQARVLEWGAIAFSVFTCLEAIYLQKTVKYPP